jgi:hypothetical protein
MHSSLHEPFALADGVVILPRPTYNASSGEIETNNPILLGREHPWLVDTPEPGYQSLIMMRRHLDVVGVREEDICTGIPKSSDPSPSRRAPPFGGPGPGH